MDLRVIEYLNRLNLYESIVTEEQIEPKTDGDLLVDAVISDPISFRKGYIDLLNVSVAHVKLIEARNKSKVVSVKKEYDEEIEEMSVEQGNRYNELEKQVKETKLINSVEDFQDPNVYNHICEKNLLEVAHNQHSKSFNKTIQIVKNTPELLKVVEQELEKVNLSFKIVQALNKAIYKKDTELFDKVSKIIKRDFQKLPFINYDKTIPLSQTLNSCLLRDLYIVDTHRYFDKTHSVITHPEIYLCKAILSKALNRFS
nr:hypothetical protein [Moritella viscosa]SHO15576.1 Type IIS restriction endonuclease, putative [Moritella viscosa]